MTKKEIGSMKKDDTVLHNDLAKDGLVRGNRVWNTPGNRGLLDISRSSFLAKVKSGELPVKPVKLGKRTTAYRLSEILSI